MAKIDDLVQQSGVSRSTVFRFLRGDNVRPAARDALLVAMRELNFEPDGFSVHRGKTLLISVRSDFKSFKGYDLSISGFMDRAESEGFHVHLKTGSALDLRPGAGSDRAPAGVLFLGRTVEEEQFESERLTAAGIPHVFVNRVFHDHRTSWVSADHQAAARDAVNYLFDRGFREVGTWGWGSTYRLDAEKRKGYFQAHEERGVPVPPSCLDYDTHGDLEEAVERLLQTGDLPPAWFAACDEHALRFIRVVRRHGLNVPDDISIVGMDDAGQAELMNPALTTIRFPFRAAGAASFDVLKRLIENSGEQAVQIVMGHQLVIRESCGGKNP